MTPRFTVRRDDLATTTCEKQGHGIGAAGLPLLLPHLVRDERDSMAEGLGQIKGRTLLDRPGAASGLALIGRLRAVVPVSSVPAPRGSRRDLLADRAPRVYARRYTLSFVGEWV